jgi:hypothetical protein
VTTKTHVGLHWRTPLFGVYIDADYNDMIDVMVGFGPLWLIVEVRRG